MSPGGAVTPERPAPRSNNAETSESSAASYVSSTESDPDKREELDAEAQEIELTDKVLAHHDNPSLVAEEEKIEEVKQDQPASDLEANGTEATSLAPKVVPIDEPGESKSSDLDEVDTSEVEQDLDDLPPLSSSTLPSPDRERTDEPRQAAGLSGPQSATLREQGGRYMHRVSRRMRRRRGGNRFNNPVQEIVSTPGSSAAGTGAATSTEPEARTVARPENQEERAARADRVMPLISDLLKPGQEIIVQIAKEPLGQKGARITSHVALPGRYVVFMPSVSHAGVSRKIASEEERHRLKRILQKHRVGTTGGFIVRTAGEGVSEEEIAADMNFLYNLWMEIREKAEKKPAPALLHYDLDVVQRILRDRLTEDFKAIWIDNEEMYENVLSFMQRFQPALVSRVKMYTRSVPIFDAFNVTQELEKALRPKVWLKSGGYIVINQTEALVAIDINTGKFVGKSNRLEDTIVKTNTEAVKESVRQIRLRDLGGIIVVDFIDMDERKNRQKVMQALEEAMRSDRAPYKILQFNDFGLVAITRKRVKQSLERTLCSPCPYCDAAGYIKSVQTVIGEILVEAQKIAKAIEGKDVMLRVNPAVAKVLKASNNRYLEEIEDILRRPVLVNSDANLHHEKFDLA
jgi:ribonuclease G